MGCVVIRAEQLGKQYRIGERQKYKALRDTLTDAIYAPARKLRFLITRSDARPRADTTIWALKDVSFEITRGEVVGFIGRNGTGKSTLLKILSRITEPTEGFVDVYGRVGSLLEVGTGFHPELTGRENVYLNGSIIGMRKNEIDRKFDEIVAFAEIERFLDTPVKFYSSGMYMRLAFSVAAHLEPEILIVDEVLAVGDMAFQKKCLGKMEGVAREGRTVLFVSHNLAAVRSLCRRCGVLEGGRLIHYGDVHDGIAHYVQWKDSQQSGTVTFGDRGGHGPRMTFMTLLADGQSTSRVLMGERLAVRMEFESDHPVRDPRVGFLVHNEAGMPLLTVSNRFRPATPYAAPVHRGTVLCDFGPIPLVVGRYSISAYLGDFDNDTHAAEHCIVFEVAEGTVQVPPEDASLWWPTEFSYS